MKRRAESQAETRQRIVEAAFDLHGTLGPARTTFSKVAEQAGVQRQTLYAHFPDERSLYLACSAHHLDRDTPPDPAGWSDIPDREQRLKRALGEIYGWYERNAAVTGAVLRDAETNEALRDVMRMRFGPVLAGWASSLSDGSNNPEARALLTLALGFHTWRTLTQEAGLGSGAAAETMASVIRRAEHEPSRVLRTSLETGRAKRKP